MLVSRRTVVLSAAAAAAFGAPGRLAFAPSARAQANPVSPHNPKGAPFHRFMLGDVEVIQVFDGEVTRPHDPGFIRNASVDDTRKALAAAGMPDGAIPLSYTVTILRSGGRTVMFDSGNGPAGQPNAGRLWANMKEAGIAPGDIGTIVVTHFHGDHIFGLMDAQNAPLYPNAEILMPDAEYAYWTDPAVFTRLHESRHGLARRVQAVFPGWKTIRRIPASGEVVPGVRPVPSYGHTPGHTSFMVSSGGRDLLVLADVTNIPQLFARNPGWHAAFDQDAAMAEATRRQLFDRIVAEKLTIAGYHYGLPGAGTIQKDGTGYLFVPMG